MAATPANECVDGASTACASQARRFMKTIRISKAKLIALYTELGNLRTFVRYVETIIKQVETDRKSEKILDNE